MLSVSETSDKSKTAPLGDPSLTLPVYASLRDKQDDASEMWVACKAEHMLFKSKLKT